MSDARYNSRASGDSSLLESNFDPSDTTAPSLRQPTLTEAELQVAITLGFSEKLLPSSVTGGGGGPGPNNLDRSSARVPQSASMTNNHSNYNSNQTSGSQNQYPLFVDNYTYNLTEEQQLGLLPPLRQPDLNQIPPDVLALLLKSNRLEDIFLPNHQRRFQENPQSMNLNSQSPQQMRPSQPQQPQGFSTPQQHNATAIASHQPPGQRFQIPPQGKFNLSPFAKEFVPTTPSFPPGSSMNPQQQQQEELAFALSQINCQNQNNSFPGFAEEWDGSDCVLSTVTDMITQVTQDPASLNRCAKTTVNVLKKHLRDDDTMGVVVTLLVEQMISNSNFCYSGAKIFEILRENEISVGASTMKNAVIARMQDLFNASISSLDDPEMLPRTHGVIRVLCELYMNFQLTAPNGKRTKIDIFAFAVLEIMQKLIQKDKSLDSVKCVCQLLKLIGWEVENASNPKVRELFGLLMNELKNVKASEAKDLHPTCKYLVENTFKLQASNWNKEQEDPTPAPSSAPEAGHYSYSKNAVYYDEVPESDDDSFGDDGAIMIDDEPDEVQAAYEEFLKMSSKK